eukprot:CAMPEP_0172530830 /NCGR_PEP_ID=MMETSP1067-20121228/4451_1 /TAXON_ID=265564 ORGANISM="Thalassiosira punctigera, Strain Tpunct2005C2" /NCGR_SAMPLE_ID=MMETSP1067 /ASSEMBLY_ACC=CAM_ASM_000444 /LENGTH=425 /DNA_ID=CAMNT_0013315117 /DNA_START=178 /DNA_END=1452 /DNA_ORIENTATION=+
MSAKQKQPKKGKKRKRAKQLPEELYQIESTDRYRKLHHACSKHLHREAKVVKSFECQKVVRAIKAANESLSARAGQDNEDDGEVKKDAKNCSKALRRAKALQQKLDKTKKMDIEVLVQVGLKRLGVLTLDPSLHEGNADDNGAEEITSLDNPRSQREKLEVKDISPQIEEEFYRTLLESMLRHKRLSAALDQLNEKVTNYRQWTKLREAILRGEDDPADHSTGSKKKKKINQQQGRSNAGNETMVVAGGFNSRKRGLDLGGHEGASGLFIGSLSGTMPVEGYDEGSKNYGDGGDGEEADYGYHGYQGEKKKNRMGQRARRAKAMAIEARSAGKTWDSSVNWREKKKERNENGHDAGERSAKGEGGGRREGRKSREDGGGCDNGEGGAKPKEAQHIAAMGKTWKEDGNAHPSWAAAAAQKSQRIAK